MVATAFLVFW